MGAVTFGIPEDLVRALIGGCGLSLGIETGTYQGGSTRFLASLLDEVWTVEIDPHLSSEAQSLSIGFDNIHFLVGDSSAALGEILSNVSSPALVWLDGHGGTFGGDDLPEGVSECPVLNEIEALRTSPGYSDSCILIDDARAFCGPMPQHRNEEWPTITEVFRALGADEGRYVTVLDDVVIATDERHRPVIEQWWLAKQVSRQSEQARVLDPSPRQAMRALVRAVTPGRVKSLRRRMLFEVSRLRTA